MKSFLIVTLVFLSFFSTKAQSTFDPTTLINTAGAVDSFKGGYTFAYATAGSPWNGAFMSFGGLDNRYDCQLSTDYGPNGGSRMSFRTHNGDALAWNSWNEIWHSGNLNNYDTDLMAKNMHVNGNLWAKEVKVASTNPWPDYVFTKDYELPSLQETAKQIQETGHLPDIPSASEVKANGIDLGEMNAKLLKKIEELTLYLIEKDKEIQILKTSATKIESLEKRVNQLEDKK